MNSIMLDWPAFKAAYTSRGGLLQSATFGNIAYAWFWSGNDKIETAIFTDSPDHAAYLAELQAMPANKAPPSTPDGKPISSSWPTEGSRSTFISVNWCDKTTWYHQAVRVVDQVANGSLTTWSVPHTNLIDTYHAKISGEDFLKDASGNSYRVRVTVGGVAKAEKDPHTNVGDFTVNYATGVITFDEAQLVAPLVTYHYATSSQIAIAPKAGKVLKLVSVEAQFSADIVVNDSVIFQPYGLASYFAPQLGLPAGYKIPLGNPTVYKSMIDYINEANLAQPVIVALGGTSWRGLPCAINVFNWDYDCVTDLLASRGMEIRVKLQHDEPFGGSVATATFYCLSVNEG